MKKASKILFIISLIITISLSIFFGFMYIDYHNSYLNATDDTYRLALVFILIILLVFGSIGYILSSILNIIGTILIKKDGSSFKFFIVQLIFIFVPIILELIYFLAFYLHP